MGALRLRSSVEVKLCVSLLNNLFVSFFEVLGKDYVSVLAHCLHASLLSDRSYVCGRHFLWPTHKVLKTFLTSVRKWEFNLSIKTAWPKQGGIQGVSAICCHDNLDVHGLVEAVHLLEELDKDTLDLSIGTGIGIVSFCCDCVNFINKDNRGRIFLCHPENISDHARAFTKVLLDEL